MWFNGAMIYPAELNVERPAADMPTDCAADFEEARQVLAKSPRAAAALLRLCVQRLMPHVGQPDKSINDAIAALVVDGLPPLMQQSLDICRVVGNNAVHPGEIDLNDTPELARELFSLINFIVADRITRPREVEALYKKLPEASRVAIERRDGTAAADA